MRVRLVSTEGPGLEAVIEVGGQSLRVMDSFSDCLDSTPVPGLELDVELSGNLLSDETWETVFAGNPHRKKGLEHLGGWRYRAFGEVIGIRPLRVDCGLYVERDVVHTSDSRVIGEYISFEVTRLDALLRPV